MSTIITSDYATHGTTYDASNTLSNNATIVTSIFSTIKTTNNASISTTYFTTE